MQFQAASLVLLAAVMHATWNALVKTGQDRVLTMALVIGVGSALAAALLPFVPAPVPASWVFLLLSALIHVGYFFCLLQAYRFGDLSHTYPIARGAAPLLVALGAALFANEPLRAREAGGLALVSVAIGSLAVERGWRGGQDPRPLLFGLGTAVTIAAYTVVDGLGVRRSQSPGGFVAWLLILDSVPMVAYAWVTRRGRIAAYLRGHWRPGLVGGVLAATAYGLVIWALSLGAMAHVSALRETSVIFAALIGSVALGEPFGGRRVLAATLVAAGLVVMNLPG